MIRIKEFLKAHWIAVVLAFMVGAISVAPQIVAMRDAQYKGIQMFGTDAEYFYVGRMNHSLYEDYSQGPFPVDPGKNYYLLPKLGERLMAAFSVLFHTQVPQVNVALKFFGPVILTLILYGWSFEMFSSKTSALISSSFVILGINLLDPGNPFATIGNFLPYTRPLSPLLSSLFLFLGLWGIYRLWFFKPKLRLAFSLMLGAWIGLSLYEYIYSWTYLVVVLGLCLLYLVFKREWNKVKYFFIALLANFIALIPYFHNLLIARKDSDYLYMAARQGLLHSHAPILGIWVVIGAVIVIFLWPAPHQNTKRFFIILVSALFVVLNQQIITGLLIQPGHYHWFTTKPIIAIIISFVGLYWLRKFFANKKLQTGFVVLLLGLFFINAIAIQAYSYSDAYPTFQKLQKYAPVLAFLNQTYPLKKNVFITSDFDVVYTQASYLVLDYTHLNAPLVPDNYSESLDTVRDQLFLGYRLRGIHGKDILGVLTQERGNVTTSLFGIYYRDLPGSHELSDTQLQDLSGEYAKFYKMPIKDVFEKLHLDIIINDNGNTNLASLPFLKIVYTEGDMVVYEFNPTQ